MALSVEQLQNPPTRGEVTNWFIKLLQQLGFQASGWQEGRLAHTMLNMAATGVSALGQTSATTINSTTNDAGGTALTEYSRSRFSNERVAAAATEGVFTLTSTATVPYTLAPGQLTIFDPRGVTFTSTSGGTLVAGGTLDINVKCESAGEVGNISNDATLQFQTPLAGVTVTNPSPGDDAEGNELPWYSIVTGRDAELDNELQARNSTKWGLLSAEKTSTALKNIALNQDGVEKATIVDDNPRGDYTVDVYVAAASSLVSTAQITAAQEAFAERTFNTESVWPPTESPRPSSVYVKNPTAKELKLAGNVFYDPQYSETDMAERVGTALNDFVKLVPIGGRDYAAGVTNTVTVGDIFETIERVRGVETVQLSEVGAGSFQGNASDIQLAKTDLLTPPGPLPDDWFDAALLVLAPVNT